MNVNMLIHRIKYSVHLLKHVLFEVKMQRLTPKYQQKLPQIVQINHQVIEK